MLSVCSFRKLFKGGGRQFEQIYVQSSFDAVADPSGGSGKNRINIFCEENSL